MKIRTLTQREISGSWDCRGKDLSWRRPWGSAAELGETLLGSLAAEGGGRRPSPGAL